MRQGVKIFDNVFLRNRENFVQADYKGQLVSNRARIDKQNNFSRLIQHYSKSDQVYTVAKRTGTDAPPADPIDKLIYDYLEAIRLSGEGLVLSPELIPKIDQNTLIIRDIMMTDAIANAIEKFISQTRGIEEFRVKCLFFENTRIAEHQFKSILRGLKQ